MWPKRMTWSFYPRALNPISTTTPKSCESTIRTTKNSETEFRSIQKRRARLPGHLGNTSTYHERLSCSEAEDFFRRHGIPLENVSGNQHLHWNSPLRNHA